MFIVLFLTVGCGKEGNRVSGKITFDGKPVPAGKIYFTPDSSKDNSGVPGFADIVAGQYDTRLLGGRGTSSGPMVVAIEGLDPNSKPAGAERCAAPIVLPEDL